MKTIQRAYKKRFYLRVKHHSKHKDRVPYRTVRTMLRWDNEVENKEWCQEIHMQELSMGTGRSMDFG